MKIFIHNLILFTYVFSPIYPTFSIVTCPQEYISDFIGLPVGKTYQYTTVLPSIPLQSIPPSASKSSLFLYKEVIGPLKRLTSLANSYDINLLVISAYRSHKLQDYFYRTKGSHCAEPAGYSEHQIGTAVDFHQVTSHSVSFLWLLEYGIPQGWIPTYYYRHHSHIQKEPWHWRYVGMEAAHKFYLQWKVPIEKDKARLAQRYKIR